MKKNIKKYASLALVTTMVGSQVLVNAQTIHALNNEYQEQVVLEVSSDYSKLVINEVYGGGGKEGKDGAENAPYKYDFIEIYNPTNEDINLEGLSLRYTNNSGKTIQTYNFEAGQTIKANDYFLLRCEATLGNDLDKGFGQAYEADAYFDAPEAGIGMSESKGNVELLKGEEVVDAVAFGNPEVFKGEGTSAEALDIYSSARRVNFSDTNNNVDDFAKVEVSPTKSGCAEGEVIVVEEEAQAKLDEMKSSTYYDKLEVLTDMGNDAIYTLGGRSFSMFRADTMELVFYSGDDFEQITAQRLPEVFNCSNDSTKVDRRSTKKGPEAEDIKVGKVGDKTYAYIGLERIGGVMTYDITNPNDVKFMNYENTRDFSSDIAGDSAPEGIDFINASISPTETPLLLVANEVSGTVAVYEVEGEKSPGTGGTDEDGSTDEGDKNPGTGGTDEDGSTDEGDKNPGTGGTDQGGSTDENDESDKGDVDSPQTSDAGILSYVGLGLTGIIGLAVSRFRKK